MAKVSLLNLPLAKSLPQFNYLTADPSTPSVQEIFTFSEYKSETAKSPDVKPSFMRRAGRAIKAHYSFVTPLPTEFPYGVPPALIEELKANQDLDDDPENLKIDLEAMLARLEPSLQHLKYASSESGLTGYTNDIRQKTLSKAELFGVSYKVLEELLPNLDVGEEGSRAREELIDILSGKVVAARVDADRENAFAPWSLTYGGHQFGSWAGQLGDGRAVSILTTPSSAQWTEYYSPPVAELQLKGAGRTPYSRFADGLAVLRSSVREYLGSEAMAALGIPTSRALSLIHLPEIEVRRERMETAAIVCRVAPSWLRLGSFEIHRSREDWSNLIKLVRYASQELFNQKDQTRQARNLVEGVAKRTAKMIAGWQAYGFMHGVMNTDNFSVLGLTIDYGPYAFMDIFDRMHICNHSDDAGRYAYKLQPSMGEFAIRKLGDAIAEIIGAEMMSEQPLTETWSEELDRKQMLDRRQKGLEFVNDVAQTYKTDLKAEYNQLMSKRLGFLDTKPEDDRAHVETLFDIMENYQLDFFKTFRTLCRFTSAESPDIDEYIASLVPITGVPKHYQSEAHEKTKEWLRSYERRLVASEESASASSSDRRSRMSQVNPRFVLRQWVLEEAIARLEQKQDIAFLELVLQMAIKPFELYGENEQLTAVEKEQARLCGIGSEEMRGFQCSCSS